MDAANHALASYLARSGRDVCLVAHRVDAALAALGGVRVRAVPRPLGSHLLGFPLLARAAAREAAARGGVALANGGNFPGAATWLHYVHAAYRPRVEGQPLRRVVQRAAAARARRDERRVAGGARVLVANSALTARHAVELLGADPAAVHVVYYGADPARFRPPTPEERARARAALGVDGPVLAFVGALGDRRKGFDTLFDACVRLARGDPGWDAVLLVAGAGGELDAWRRRAVREGVDGRIRFLGFQPDVLPLLHASDALVAPTRYEAYGLAVQEALCTGLPALVTRAAGVAERIPPPLSALLAADPEDAGGLAELLRLWRSGMERYRADALALSANLRGWTWDDMAARIVDIVEEGA
jgi:glycosyltransferase involved in cell wall biosynthesis